jgi:hypothetical protein
LPAVFCARHSGVKVDRRRFGRRRLSRLLHRLAKKKLADAFMIEVDRHGGLGDKHRNAAAKNERFWMINLETIAAYYLNGEWLEW